MRRALAAGALLLALGAGPPGAAAGAKLPRVLAWAEEALAADVKVEEGAPAVTLFDEARVYFQGSGGKCRYERRTLVRILSAEGRDLSLQPVYYGQNSTLLSFDAWTIRPDGTVEPFDKKDAVDFSLSDAAVYSDSRARVLPLRNVGVGSAIAVQFARDEDRFFLQDEWYFQDDYPVARSRYQVTRPTTWSHEARLLNHPPTEPDVHGDTLTWELRDLPGLAVGREPEAPPVADQAARLTISFLPREGWGGAERFRSWAEVAAWYHALVEGQALTDEEIRRAVADLTKGATSDLERIRRIGRFVQDLRYVSISLGLSAYRPHPSPEVFRNRYADCKDKTTLMLAMLREAGIASHPLLVDTRDAGKVFAEFPSPLQFNHCIIAIPVPPNTVENALVIHPDMGDVLVFDPTDELTPVGDLPWSDQGTRALLVHPERGGLVDLPALPPAANLADRSWEVSLAKDGQATVRLRATHHGQYARLLRARYAGIDDAARVAALTAWMAHSVPGARVGKVEFRNLAEGDLPLEIEAEIDVAGYARRAGPLLLAEPLRLAPTLAPDVTPAERKRPILMPFRFEERDRLRLALPEGYRVSEPPAGDSAEAPLGRYRVEHRAADAGWEVERLLVVDRLEIDPADYAAARSFLDSLRRAAAAVLVLERASS
jgi:hypothetical protein